MAIYSFETITAAQALTLTALDTVTLGKTVVTAVTVIYNTEGPNVTVSAGGTTTVFAPMIETISMAGGLRGADGAILLIGDAGGNRVTTQAGDDALFGGAGNDVLDAGEGANLLQGNAGADFLSAGSGNDTVYGGQDNDDIATGNGINFAQGNKGNDLILGGMSADTLLGGQGDDSIGGATGQDFLNGNLGNDNVGGEGSIFGEGGNDTLSGHGGSDTISGGDGDDKLFNVSGYSDGDAGNDTLSTGGVAHNNTMVGGDGNDVIDVRFANSDVHTSLSGGAGDDSILGSVGIDTIAGGNGNDTIQGNGAPAGGSDLISGGAGQDLFLISTRVYGSQFAPLDAASIADWEVGDQLHFLSDGLPAGSGANYGETSAPDYNSAYSAAKAMHVQSLTYVSVQVGANVAVFSFSPALYEHMVVLTGRSLADIDASSII